jgi:hypothetical protein
MIQQFKRGDLVKILTHTKMDALLKKKNICFLATIIECRYKTDAYKVFPANSPFTEEAYWVGGYQLELVK